MPVSVRSSTLYNPIIPLKTTFADCENTTSEIDIVTVTIPANTLAVGDIIEIYIEYIRSQNSGGAINLNMRTYKNAILMTSSNPSISTTANILKLRQKWKIVYDSSFALWEFWQLVTGTSGAQDTALGIGTTGGATINVTAGSRSSLTLSDSNILKVSAQWASANANAYIRIANAQAYIIKKAV
jgi:hypothetical protein